MTRSDPSQRTARLFVAAMLWVAAVACGHRAGEPLDGAAEHPADVAREGATSCSKACDVAEDCACGRDAITGDCAVGRKECIDVQRQCPDFCTGIAGNLRTVCENHICVTRTAPQP